MIESTKRLRQQFNIENKKIYKKGVFTFLGVDGFDVYNCSVPFFYNHEEYMFCRVEKREEYDNSLTCLFKRIDEFTWIKDGRFEPLPIEDPFLTMINGEFILGGTYEYYENNIKVNFEDKFYKGTSPFNLKYFTSGPSKMKDIRLVQLDNGRIGVFSRDRDLSLKKIFGTQTQIEFFIIDKIEDLCPIKFNNKKFIKNFYFEDEWGGINQANYLGDNKIQVIAHQCYNETNEKVGVYPVYVITSFIYDIERNEISDNKIIADRNSFLPTDYKNEKLRDVAFVSGINSFTERKVLLYSGLNDCKQGFIEIDNPFI